MTLSPGTKLLIHMIAGAGGFPIAITFIPEPWGALVGALWTAAVAAAAFVDQSWNTTQ